MSKLKLQTGSYFFLLMIAGSLRNKAVGAADVECLNQSNNKDCCAESEIAFSEQIMTPCRDLPNENNYTDLGLMNICEIHCYLNNSKVIDDNGAVQRETLVDFLKEYLNGDEFKVLLNSTVEKCLNETNFSKDTKFRKLNCLPYYDMLIDCIQYDIFSVCLGRNSSSSESYSDYSYDSDISFSSSSLSSEYDSNQDSESSESDLYSNYHSASYSISIRKNSI